MKWINRFKENRRAHEDLYDIISNNPVCKSVENGNIWFGVTKLSRETAVEVRKFISRNILKHPDIALNVLGVLQKYFDASTRIRIIMRNFDHAVELGWRYSPNAFSFILESIDEVRESRFVEDRVEFTQEQEAALLIFGDSQWEKDTSYTHSFQKRRYTCDESVSKVVLERPHEVAAIIEVAMTANVTHAAHLIAVLDGEITSVLGEGAL